MAQQQQQQLSHKDGALFRQVVRHFENKQYKKGKHNQFFLHTPLTSICRSQSRGTGPAQKPQPRRHPSNESSDH
jgi:hypothetical protein